MDDFGLIVALANARLKQLGVDLSRDPLLQVLPTTQIARSLEDYADTYGETDWSESDWAVVLGAGLIATILDIVLVGIAQRLDVPREASTQGSPLTKWLKDGDLAADDPRALPRSARSPWPTSPTTPRRRPRRVDS